jgi:hypothetical protein
LVDGLDDPPHHISYRHSVQEAYMKIEWTIALKRENKKKVELFSEKTGGCDKNVTMT